MRLLHVVTFLGVGGAERIVMQLSSDALDRGDAVAVASSGGPWRHDAEARGAEWHTVSLERRYGIVSPRAAWALRSVVRRFRPDIVHTHSVGGTLAARAALVGTGGPSLLTTFHGVAPEHYRHAARLLRVAAPRVIACSDTVATTLAASGFPAARVTVIPNGADLEPATQERIAAVRRAHVLPEQNLVVGIGRLAPQKSWHTLIEASRHLPGVPIVVAGPGELYDELRSAARGTDVRFIGPVDDVAALLGCAACWVSTSAWEGLPLTLLEALSIGVPAVATAVDGVSDVVKEGAALLVPAGDPAAVAVAIRRILEDSSLAGQLSRAGRSVAAEWSSDKMVARYRDVYRHLISEAAANGYG